MFTISQFIQTEARRKAVDILNGHITNKNPLQSLEEIERTALDEAERFYHSRRFLFFGLFKKTKVSDLYARNLVEYYIRVKGHYQLRHAEGTSI